MKRRIKSIWRSFIRTDRENGLAIRFLTAIVLYILGFLFISKKDFILAPICLMYAIIVTGSIVEALLSITIHGYWLIFLIFTAVISAVTLGGMGHGDFASSTIWTNFIPGNDKVIKINDIPLQTFVIYLEKENSPVYVRINPHSSYNQDVEFHMYDPNGHVVFSKNTYGISCARQIGCNPFIFKLCYNQSGEYKIKARSIKSFSPSITIDIIKSRWIEPLYRVRRSSCPMQSFYETFPSWNAG